MVPHRWQRENFPGTNLGSRNRSGLTLLELMVGLAIVTSLAAVALSVYEPATRKAKRAELEVNVASITDAVNFREATDGFTNEVTWTPDNTPGRDLRPWTSGTGFSDIPWSPDGDVRCSYRIKRPGNSGNVRAEGVCDLDQDGETYECASQSNSGNLSIPVDCAPNDEY